MIKNIKSIFKSSTEKEDKALIEEKKLEIINALKQKDMLIPEDLQSLDIDLKMDKEDFYKAKQFQINIILAIEDFEKEGSNSLAASFDKDIIVTLGNTGEGKSTLLNVITGKKLIASRDNYILDSNEENSFRIGEKQLSGTLYPNCLEVGNSYFVDLPGFFDTRGSEVSVLNALCIKNVLLKARTVRFIILCSISSIETKRGESFKQILNKIENLFPDPNTLIGTSIFVISKTDILDTGEIVEELKDKLEGKYFESIIKTFVPKKKIIEENENNELSGNFFILPFPKAIRNEPEKTQKLLDFTKNNLLSLLDSLEKVKIEEINRSTLLDKGAEDSIKHLFRIIAALSWKKIYSELLNDIEVDCENLKNIVNEKLIDQMLKYKEIEFISLFEKSLFDECIESNSFDLEIKKLKKKINKKKLKKSEEESRIKAQDQQRILENEQKRVKDLEDELKKANNEIAIQRIMKEQQEQFLKMREEMDKLINLNKELSTKQEAIELEKKKQAEHKERLNKIRKTELYRKANCEINDLHLEYKNLEKNLEEAKDYKDNTWTITKIAAGIVTLGHHTYKHYNEIECINDLMNNLRRQIRAKLEDFMNTFEEKHNYHDNYN